MVAEIVRQRQVGDRTQLDVQHGHGRYAVWVVPARGMNHEVVGYRVWIGNATLLLGSEEQAIAAALSAIDRIRGEGPGAGYPRAGGDQRSGASVGGVPHPAPAPPPNTMLNAQK
jgi:hypothetical protein